MEVPANGIDDNCDGTIDEVPQTDVVTITRATWKRGPGKLIVEAISDQQPQMILTLDGFGTMTYNPDTTRYSYTSPNKTANPGTVTVTSSGGGVATVPVQ